MFPPLLVIYKKNVILSVNIFGSVSSQNPNELMFDICVMYTLKIVLHLWLDPGINQGWGNDIGSRAKKLKTKKRVMVN